MNIAARESKAYIKHAEELNQYIKEQIKEQGT